MDYGVVLGHWGEFFIPKFKHLFPDKQKCGFNSWICKLDRTYLDIIPIV